MVYALSVSQNFHFYKIHYVFCFRFFADTHGDGVAARYSYDHSAGGVEYYWKMLKRNRILRDLLPNGSENITAVGDVRGIATRIVVRYDLLKDVGIEDDEIKAVEAGDV